ncbi:hypothetical protein RND81_05G098400 [Saponaria officinalis]|uniref:F-box domain-containing protein n=1 Tax=Saponaria officinalis TaxID=3572 RepID=A0AAW1KWB6_SAPOF
MDLNEEEVPEQQELMQISKNYRQNNEGDVYEIRELPHDLITMHILTRVPTKSVLRFKLVSKQWYSTLSSYHFCNAHFKLSSLINPSNPNHFVIIQNRRSFYLLTYNEGGENGLVKLEHDFREDNLGFIVKGRDDNVVLIGSSSIDDYKIVRIVELPRTREIMVHVFPMKSNSWRRIDPREYEHVLSMRPLENRLIIYGYCYLFHTNRGVVCDERVNWIVARLDENGKCVISFDLVNETFEIYDNLEPPSPEMYWNKFVCVVRGCLSICGVSMRGGVSVCTNVLVKTTKGKKFGSVDDWV